jgi:hypothetical protein
MVRGADMAAEVIRGLWQAARTFDVDEETFHLLAKEPVGNAILEYWARHLATVQMIRKCQPYRVETSHRSVREAIKAVGCPGKYTNCHLVAVNFGVEEGPVQVDERVFLWRHRYPMVSEEVKIEMFGLGLRPANLLELCGLGERHPDLQKENPIVALGSCWREGCDKIHVPVLGTVGMLREREREFTVIRCDESKWGRDFRFAGVLM